MISEFLSLEVRALSYLLRLIFDCAKRLIVFGKLAKILHYGISSRQLLLIQSSTYAECNCTSWECCMFFEFFSIQIFIVYFPLPSYDSLVVSYYFIGRCKCGKCLAIFKDNINIYVTRKTTPEIL